MKALTLGVALAGMLPGTAMAATQYYIPPGNSGANQYVESLPTAGGSSSRPVITHGPGGSASIGQVAVLAPSAQSALVRQGQDGIRAAAVANATAPTSAVERQQALETSGSSHRRAGHHASGGGAGTGGSPPGGASSGGSSAAGLVLRSLTGLGGPGAPSGLLPLVLILVFLGGGAIALRRRQVG